jgi:O-antigen/teichoic acid export membrane protein
MSTVWLVMINAPLYLTVCLTAPILVRLLGPRYHAGISSMIVVTAAALVGSAVGPVDYVLITLGRTSWTLINTVLALAINITIDLVFVSRSGIIAAAIGWAAAIVTTNLIPLVQVWRTSGFSPFSELWLRVMMLAAYGFAIAPAATLLIAGKSLPAMVVVLTITTIGYLVVLWRWRGELIGADSRH